jgi:hypothetical protein
MRASKFFSKLRISYASFPLGDISSFALGRGTSLASLNFVEVAGAVRIHASDCQSSSADSAAPEVPPCPIIHSSNTVGLENAMSKF